ncbi:MAG: hypothetical protein Q9164_003375 [Protoblastenia rupestris]
MPLTELPVNHIGRNGIIEQRPDALHAASAQSGISGDHDKPIFGPSPLSVQSMLKNTTETGDIGQFSIQSNRKPQSAFRPPPEGLTRRATKSHRAQGTDGHFNMRYDRRPSPGLSRDDTTASSVVSSIPSHCNSSYRGPSRVTPVEEYRSYSMTQSSYVSHNLAQRQPCINGGYQGQGNGRSGRPRSPFAYPTRLKRPGYRPSSPALSDTNRPGYYSRPNSRPVSPASVYSTNRAPATWQQSTNRSDPSLRNYSPCHVKGHQQYRYPSPAPSQPSTPRQASSLRSVASASRIPRAQLSMQNMWTHPESPPPSPLFYDYTEAFEESHHLQRISMSSTNLHDPNVSNLDQDIWYKSEARTPESSPIELPNEVVKHNATPITPHAKRHRSSRLSTRRESLVLPTQPENEQAFIHFKDSRGNTSGTSTSVMRASVMIDGENIRPSSTLTTEEALLTGQLPYVQAAKGNRRASGADPASMQIDIARLEESQEYEGSPCSSADSMRTAESNSLLEPERVFNSPTPIIPGALPVTPPKNSISESAKDSPAAKSAKTIKEEAPEDLTFEGHSTFEHTEIVSPTPERSITSPTNRNRYSKILGLEDSLFGLDDSVSKSHLKKGPTEKTSYQPPLRIRESLANSSTINTSILEDSVSDDEKKLLSVLQKTCNKRPDQSTQTLNSSAESQTTSSRTYLTSPLPSNVWSSATSRQENRSAPEPLIPRTSPAESETSKQPLHSAAAIQHRHAQVLSSNCKPLLHVDKELPPVPKRQRSFVAITPPTEGRRPEHPFSFTPLVNKSIEDDPLVELEGAAVSLTQYSDVDDCQMLTPAVNSKNLSDRVSVASSHGSRPWNNDSNYPWSDQPPDLEVTNPQPAEVTPSPTERKFPRFKLRIQRASTSSVGTTRLSKHRPSTDETSSSKRNSGHDFTKTATFKRKVKPRVSVSPGQNNSSHDIGNEPLRTRFVESFDPPPQITTLISSPTITLLPPSPGHEVRSFFSDDSSQARQKGSLRKRLSDFKARHSQTNSADDIRGYDRGLLSSALAKSRASGRSSRQSQNTAGASSYTSQIKQMRSKVMNKVRFWWQRGEDRIRDWGWRVRHRQDRSQALHADLYPGA